MCLLFHTKQMALEPLKYHSNTIIIYFQKIYALFYLSIFKFNYKNYDIYWLFNSHKMSRDFIKGGLMSNGLRPCGFFCISKADLLDIDSSLTSTLFIL